MTGIDLINDNQYLYRNSVHSVLILCALCDNIMAKPKLINNVIITTQIQRGETVYLIKEPIEDQYYKFGKLEFKIIELCDGTRNLQEITNDINKIDPDAELELDDIKGFIMSIYKMNILEKTLAEKNVILTEKKKAERKSKFLSKKGSLLYKRFPIVNPNKFFDKIQPKISFFWKKPFVIFTFLVMIAAVSIIIARGNEYIEGVLAVYSFSNKSLFNFFTLWLTIMTIIAFHECAHGLTCKNFGGNVSELGFLLLLFNPCLYANVTDAYSFPKRKHRLCVVFAGVYFEFFLGAIATFIWVFTNPETFLNSAAFQVMTVAGISTVVFNLNPLIKLDGYYALSDYLEIPNLKAESQNFLKAFVTTHIFKSGTMEDYEETNYHTKCAYFIYGITSVIYMCFMLTTILMVLVKDMVLNIFHEVGLVIFFLIAYKLVGRHFVNLFKFLKNWFVMKGFTYKTLKGIILFSIVIFLFTFFIFLYKYENNILSPCTLKSNEDVVLHTPADGFLKKVYYSNSQKIPKNSTIVELYNLELYDMLKNKLINLKNLKLKHQIFKSQGNMYAMTDLKSKINILKRDIDLLNKKVNLLRIRYPKDSILISEDLTQYIGRKYKKGEAVANVTVISTLYAVLHVDQFDIGFINPGDSAKLKLNAIPKQVYTGIIERITPPNPNDDRLLYKVTVAFKNINRDLLPGMSGYIKIVISNVNGFEKLKLWFVKTFKFDMLFY